MEEGANKDLLLRDGTELFAAATSGNLDMVHFLVAVGCDKDRTNAIGATPLYFAAANGHLDVVRFLAESGANLLTATGYGRTALDVASEIGHAGIGCFSSQFGTELQPRKARRLNSPNRG